mgnify:CR=1 FL=1
MRGLSLLDCEIIECMDSIPYALFLYLISGKMQKSNVTSFLRVVLKKTRKKKVKKLLLTTVKQPLSVSLYEGIIFLSYFKEKRIKKC